MSYSSPCKGCNKKYPGCRFECEDLLDFEENKKAIQEEKAAHRQMEKFEEFESSGTGFLFDKKSKKSKDRKF